MLQVFFQVGSPRPPHEETHLNISQLGVDVIWAKCCEMKVELKLQRATFTGEENLIPCNPLYRDHMLTVSCTQLHFNTYIGSFMPCPSWMGEDAGEEMV